MHRATSGKIRLAPPVVITVLGVLCLACACMLYRFYSAYVVEQRWKNDLERLGASAVSVGYGRIIPRQQVELFLYDRATIDAVLDKAAEYPQLGRVWIDLTVFDRSMVDRIRQRLPGVDVVFYTPGPGMPTARRR